MKRLIALTLILTVALVGFAWAGSVPPAPAPVQISHAIDVTIPTIFNLWWNSGAGGYTFNLTADDIRYGGSKDVVVGQFGYESNVELNQITVEWTDWDHGYGEQSPGDMYDMDLSLWMGDGAVGAPGWLDLRTTVENPTDIFSWDEEVGPHGTYNTEYLLTNYGWDETPGSYTSTVTYTLMGQSA